MTYLKNVPLKLDYMHADDVLLYNTINTKEDCLTLQEDLNTLQLWADKWQMMFNPDKYELIRITNTKLPILYHYNILKKKIKVASSISKANTSRAFLQRNIDSCPRAIKGACYRMIHPIIEYAAIIWSPYTQSLINNLETVQRKAARFVCNNYYRYSSVSEML